MTEKENTIESIHIQAKLWDTEEKAFWQQFKQTNGLTENSETLRAIVNQLRTFQSSPVLKASLPEGCLRCDLHGVLTTNKKGELIVRCIERLANKQPITRDRFISEAETCSQKPTHITLPIKEKYELAIQLLNGQLDREAENTDKLLRESGYYEGIKKESLQKDLDIETLEKYQKEIEKQLKETNRKLQPMQNVLAERDALKSRVSELDNSLLEKDYEIASKQGKIDQLTRDLQPMQDLLTEKGTLNSKVFEMGNSLVEANHKIATLETDNAYKDEQINKLSESELSKQNSEILKESDALHLELAKKSKVINDYELDIQKTEALSQVRLLALSEVASKTTSLFRDVKQILPTNDSKPISSILLFHGEGYRDMLKRIEAFEGYLETMKDKALRGS